MRRMEGGIVASWHRRCVAGWRVDASRRPAFAISLTSNKMPRPQRQWCWRGKASCLTVACTSCCLKSDAVQAQPRPHQARPGWARPDQTRPDLAKPSRVFARSSFSFTFFCYETVHPYKPLAHAHSSVSVSTPAPVPALHPLFLSTSHVFIINFTLRLQFFARFCGRNLHKA